MIEQDILFKVLLDFMKELPEEFDRNHTTYAQACDIINNFMKKHGLTVQDE